MTGLGVVVTGAAPSHRFAAEGARVVVDWRRRMSQFRQRFEELT